MRRAIIGFELDANGERIARLACGHAQHVRHQPPFINRPWTETAEGRASMLGTELNCVLCDANEPWMMLDLGDGMLASGTLGEIESAFRERFVAAGRPSNMAVFQRHESQGLHCAVTAYFSPAAKGVAESFGEVRACARPVRAGLELLAGEKAAWGVLFD
jgi:hypothetical protein